MSFGMTFVCDEHKVHLHGVMISGSGCYWGYGSCDNHTRSMAVAEFIEEHCDCGKIRVVRDEDVPDDYTNYKDLDL